jgi:hypothetical protein
MADDAYGGPIGAFPYAFRASDSRLLQSYVVLGGLTAAFVAIVFTLAVVVLIGNTAGGSGGTLTLSRAFFILVGLSLVAPLLAPVLLVARRHRRATSTARYDAALAATGYLFAVGAWAGAVVAARSPAGLPAAVGLAFPIAAVALMWLAHRRYRDE